MILTGFMGSGKTTAGKRVAGVTGKEFIDLDHYIVEENGQSINSIFESQGESGFRQIEKEALKNVIGNTDAVISTGGGIITYEESRNLLKENRNHTVYFLSAPFDLLYERVKNDEGRPMLKNGYDSTKKLYDSRLKFYEETSHYQIDASLDVAEIETILLEMEGLGNS
ncbi:shikimate kinase [Salinicoccus sp. YB14-2]|uniref:shikimate kinase n=1 Tax=Salinicoccus sp. YB14-2 TaxID=1572701 RepID=UPI000691F6E5|nr:shikimate kinase [Salinicoccus sp. YB14-2]